ncbi:MAG: proline dehydrogenase family protein [Gemmatimonadetes bacterium]|nr:proline dehydrogenase family protein [Gemmatimonadota bacterium]
MFRIFLLFLSRQATIFRFVRNNGFAKAMASRFVAGETIATATAAVADLNAQGITASLDLLGESVTNAGEARAAGTAYLELLDAIAAKKLDANVSLKMTAMGQDIDDALCEEIVSSILERARTHGSFVRLDMESSAYTQRTIDFFEQRLYPRYREQVGIVLQSALRRTTDDVEKAIALGCRVRLCKGAYLEPATVAFPDKRDVDAHYVSCMKTLMERGNYAGLATHDAVIITEAIRFARERGIAADRFEFQMLYGVRRDLQAQIVRDGYRLRVYVPFGTQWYPYLMRRLAERPANLWFITGNILREVTSGTSARPVSRT